MRRGDKRRPAKGEHILRGKLIVNAYVGVVTMMSGRLVESGARAPGRPSDEGRRRRQEVLHILLSLARSLLILLLLKLLLRCARLLLLLLLLGLSLSVNCEARGC